MTLYIIKEGTSITYFQTYLTKNRYPWRVSQGIKFYIMLWEETLIYMFEDKISAPQPIRPNPATNPTEMDFKETLKPRNTEECSREMYPCFTQFLHK